MAMIIPADSLLITSCVAELVSRISACHALSERRAFRNDSVPAALGKIDSSAIEQAQRRIAANLNQQEGSWSDGAREQVRDRSYWDIS
ncbi:MAG TPA: hypothetical protein VGQ63_08260 [Pseudolabrys sp.]|nr:hypothetical protein [Pseudolabrys sp.]